MIPNFRSTLLSGFVLSSLLSAALGAVIPTLQKRMEQPTRFPHGPDTSATDLLPSIHKEQPGTFREVVTRLVAPNGKTHLVHTLMVILSLSNDDDNAVFGWIGYKNRGIDPVILASSNLDVGQVTVDGGSVGIELWEKYKQAYVATQVTLWGTKKGDYEFEPADQVAIRRVKANLNPEVAKRLLRQLYYVRDWVSIGPEVDSGSLQIGGMYKLRLAGDQPYKTVVLYLKKPEGGNNAVFGMLSHSNHQDIPAYKAVASKNAAKGHWARIDGRKHGIEWSGADNRLRTDLIWFEHALDTVKFEQDKSYPTQTVQQVEAILEEFRVARENSSLGNKGKVRGSEAKEGVFYYVTLQHKGPNYKAVMVLLQKPQQDESPDQPAQSAQSAQPAQPAPNAIFAMLTHKIHRDEEAMEGVASKNAAKRMYPVDVPGIKWREPSGNLLEKTEAELWEHPLTRKLRLEPVSLDWYPSLTTEETAALLTKLRDAKKNQRPWKPPVGQPRRRQELLDNAFDPPTKIHEYYGGDVSC